MAYNPTPVQKKMQHAIGKGLVGVGVVVVFLSWLAAPFSPEVMLAGSIIAAAGNLMRVMAE